MIHTHTHTHRERESENRSVGPSVSRADISASSGKGKIKGIGLFMVFLMLNEVHPHTNAILEVVFAYVSQCSNAGNQGGEWVGCLAEAGTDI